MLCILIHNWFKLYHLLSLFYYLSGVSLSDVYLIRPGSSTFCNSPLQSFFLFVFLTSFFTFIISSSFKLLFTCSLERNNDTDRYYHSIAWVLLWILCLHQPYSFQGKLKYKETTVKGFDKMPEAFIGLFRGDNTGKAIVIAWRVKRQDWHSILVSLTGI